MGTARLQNLLKILSHSVDQRQCQGHDFSQSPAQQLCTISVTPEVTRFDQKINIRVQGLPKHSKVTLQAWTVSEWQKKKVLFLSYGHFYADEHGKLDLDRDPSLDGTYTGVDAMGLFWSMKPLPEDPQNVRCLVRNVEEKVAVNLAVFTGHITPTHQTVRMETVYPLGRTTVSRLPKSPDVKRIEIEEGSLRGTLFLPSGAGRHPGVIDMSGAAGGLMELRAALLASHGFAVLALAFFRYKDLSPTESDLAMEYFEGAVEWLSSHPAVIPGGIGLLGTSSGGTIALLMAIQCPQVKAVVNINGPPFRMAHDLYRSGKVFIKALLPDLSGMILTEEGVISKGAFPVSADIIFPVWKSSAQVLCLFCGDDNSVDPKWAEQLQSLYPANKRHLINVVVYPGAGHLLEPPYSPLCRTCQSTMTEMNIFWGGIPRPHAVTQMEAWQRTVQFFHAHLVEKTA